MVSFLRSYVKSITARDKYLTPCVLTILPLAVIMVACTKEVVWNNA
nr:MAG TPA: hypothetical protein [Caudoviricetes sp.]DAJ80953.1 MAG TPA: hypothetical protein [Caudoviricetes sp.]DAM26285.1 MAG TPA: hypothetical protein [Caudoviricetes sp.]